MSPELKTQVAPSSTPQPCLSLVQTQAWPKRSPSLCPAGALSLCHWEPVWHPLLLVPERPPQRLHVSVLTPLHTCISLQSSFGTSTWELKSFRHVCAVNFRIRPCFPSPIRFRATLPLLASVSSSIRTWMIKKKRQNKIWTILSSRQCCEDWGE